MDLDKSSTDIYVNSTETSGLYICNIKFKNGFAKKCLQMSALFV